MSTTYKGIIVVRSFLGIVEAPFWPGTFYMLSAWYVRRELARRTAILYSDLVLATAFSGLMAAGVFAGLEGARGLAGWKWLYYRRLSHFSISSRLHVDPPRLS